MSKWSFLTSFAIFEWLCESSSFKHSLIRLLEPKFSPCNSFWSTQTISKSTVFLFTLFFSFCCFGAHIGTFFLKQLQQKPLNKNENNQIRRARKTDVTSQQKVWLILGDTPCVPQSICVVFRHSWKSGLSLGSASVCQQQPWPGFSAKPSWKRLQFTEKSWRCSDSALLLLYQLPMDSPVKYITLFPLNESS